MEQDKKPIGMMIGEMMNAMLRSFKTRTGKQANITLSLEQFGLLYAIRHHKQDVVQKDMAEILGKDKSSILRMINSLEKKGLVKRVIDINDKRRNQLIVTGLGEQTIDQYLEIEFELINELIEGIEEAELNIFFKVINHIKSKAELV